MMRALLIAAAVALFIVSCGGGPGVIPTGDSFAALQQQINSLQMPVSVNPAVWQQLKQSASQVLRNYGAERAVSGAPQSELSAVTDLRLVEQGGSGVLFTWSYKNLGDYDQNSEVGVSDITPIAVHYKATSLSPNWEAARVVDGDGNGEVNASDITPIGANFLASVSGYQLQATATPSNEQSWAAVDDVPFGAGVLPAEGGTLQFSLELADPVESHVYRVAPYYSDGTSMETGIASNPRTYGTSTEVEQLLAEAQAALLEGDGITAKAKYEQVQELAPDNPTAGFGLGFIAIMSEANDVVEFLSEYNDPLFHNVALVPVEGLFAPVTHGRLWEVLSRVTVPRSASDIETREMTYEEIRSEIIAVIDVLTDITNDLDIAVDTMPDDWTLLVLEDWNDPGAGDVEVTKPDALMLSAVLDMAVGVLHFSIAYSGGALGVSESTELHGIEITGLDGEYVEPVDLNEDGLIDMAEACADLPVADNVCVLNADGRMRLTSFTTYAHGAFSKAVNATELYIDQDLLVGHWAYDIRPDEYAEFVDDWDSYGRYYANSLVATWSTGTTFVITDELLAAYPEFGDNPGEDFSLAVNLAGFFTGLPDDLRDFPARIGYDDMGDGDVDYYMPDSVDDAFPDNTMLGLFPDGLTQEQYEILFDRYFGYD